MADTSPFCGSDWSFDNTAKFEGFGSMRERLKEKPVELSWNAKAVTIRIPLAYTKGERPRDSASCKIPMSVAGPKSPPKRLNEQASGDIF